MNASINTAAAPVRTLAEIKHADISYVNAKGENATMHMTAGELDTLSTQFVEIHAGGEVDPVTGKTSKPKAEFYGFFKPSGEEKHVKIRVWAFDQELIDELKAAKDSRTRLIFAVKAARLTPYRDGEDVERLSMTLISEVKGVPYTEVVGRRPLSQSTWADELSKVFG